MLGARHPSGSRGPAGAGAVCRLGCSTRAVLHPDIQKIVQTYLLPATLEGGWYTEYHLKHWLYDLDVPHSSDVRKVVSLHPVQLLLEDTGAHLPTIKIIVTPPQERDLIGQHPKQQTKRSSLIVLGMFLGWLLVAIS